MFSKHLLLALSVTFSSFASAEGANLKLGQHLVLSKDTPLCNVWLTMLHGIGLDPKQLERHGDSTGVVKELQA